MSGNGVVFAVSLALGAIAWFIFVWAIRRANRHFTNKRENE